MKCNSDCQTLACATCISKLTCGWKSTGSRPRHSNCTIVLKRSLSSALNPGDIECSTIRERQILLMVGKGSNIYRASQFYRLVGYELSNGVYSHQLSLKSNRISSVQCCTNRRISLMSELMMLKMLTYIIRCDCVFQDICKKDKCCTSTRYFYLTRSKSRWVKYMVAERAQLTANKKTRLNPIGWVCCKQTQTLQEALTTDIDVFRGPKLKSMMKDTLWHYDIKVSVLITEGCYFRLWGVVYCLFARVFLNYGAGSSLGHRTSSTFVHTNWVFSGTKFTFLHHAGSASSSFQWYTLLWNQKRYCLSIKKSFKLDEQRLFLSLPRVLCTAIYLRPRHSFHT